MKKLLFAALSLVISLSAYAQQQQMSPEEREKKMAEAIQKEVDRLENSLKLEDWQVFFADSILNHDYRAMQNEMNEMMEAKVSSSDLYQKVGDKWGERIYNSMHKILNEEQWAKYLKSGAGREKKARDKRKAKIAASAAIVKEND